MPRYISLFSWSSASWARMIRHPDDRVALARQVCETLGSTLESFYWLPLAIHDGLIITDLPDSVTAAALTAAITSTGAVRDIQTHEMLSQEQLGEALAVATDIGHVYRPPGQFDR